MAVRRIRLLGEPVLRAKAQPVAAVDDDIRTLVRDMFETMYDADGVGLAAPQVGLKKRVIVVDPREPEVEPFALINPVVVSTGGEPDRVEEGCLSLPGLRELVERPETAVVQGLDPDGNEVEVAADGLLARVLLHEVDHLDGILFIDRVSPLKRKMLLQKWKKQQQEEERPAKQGAL